MRLPTILLLALVIAALWLAFFGRDQPRRSAAELGPPPLTQAAKTSDQGTLADLAQPERREVTGDAAPSARAQPESLPESEGAPEEGWTRVAIQAWAGLESTPLGLVDVILKGEPTRPELSALYRYQSVAMDRKGLGQVDLPPGTYHFAFDSKSLPSNLLPPPLFSSHQANQEGEVPWTNPTLELDGTTPHATVVLRAHVPGRLVGQVLGPAGTPLAGVSVGASTTNGDPMVGRSCETDSEGRYELTLYALEYRVRTQLSPKLRSQAAFAGLPSPPPVDVIVVSGTEYQQDFSFVPGPCALTGQLLNPARLPGEEDEFWVGVPVQIGPVATAEELAAGRAPFLLNDRLLQVFTDAQGRFEMRGLQPGMYSLRVHPFEGYLPTVPQCDFAQWTENIQISFDHPGVQTLPPIEIERSRACWVRGTLQFSHPDEPSRYAVRVWFANGPVPNQDVFSVEVRPTQPVFETFIHTIPGMTATHLELRRIGKDEVLVNQPFEAIPNGEVRLNIVVP